MEVQLRFFNEEEQVFVTVQKEWNGEDDNLLDAVSKMINRALRF